jgi:hypothetical protein
LRASLCGARGRPGWAADWPRAAECPMSSGMPRRLRSGTRELQRLLPRLSPEPTRVCPCSTSAWR